MCTLFANLYVLLTWGPHMVYMGTPYIFDIYMIRCGWLGNFGIYLDIQVYYLDIQTLTTLLCLLLVRYVLVPSIH